MEQCAECGFRYGDVDPGDLGNALRRLSGRYRTTLLADDVAPDSVHVRAAADVWSPVEYACHFRDVLLSQRERVLLAQVEDRPTFAPMYRDERVALARYNDEDAGVAVDEIEVAAEMLAWVFDGLSSEQLARTCIYNYPAPSERTVEWIGRHTLHEGEHHLRDVERGLVG